MSHNEVEEHEDFTNLWEIDFCDACFFLQDSKMLPKGHQIKQTKYMHDINISNFPPPISEACRKFWTSQKTEVSL